MYRRYQEARLLMNTLPREIRDKELEDEERRLQEQHTLSSRKKNSRNEIVIAEGLADTLKPSNHGNSDQKLECEGPPDGIEQFHDQGVNADLNALDDAHDMPVNLETTSI